MNEFQKKMDDCFKQIEGIRKKAESEGRAMTDKELEERKSLMSRIDTLKAEDDLQRELYGDGEGRMVPPDDPMGRGTGWERRGASGATMPENRATLGGKEGRIIQPHGKTYRSLFGLEGRDLDRGGFKDLEEFLP